MKQTPYTSEHGSRDGVAPVWALPLGGGDASPNQLNGSYQWQSWVPPLKKCFIPKDWPEIRKRALEMKRKDPMDPINLFNITWRDGNNAIYYFVLPKN